MHSRSRFSLMLLVETLGALLPLLLAGVDAQAVTLRWTKTSGSGREGFGVAVAADGSIYVTGKAQTGHLLLEKYSPAGALRWSKTFYGTPHSPGEGRGAAVAADGSVYVAGVTEVEGESHDLLLQKYSPGGALRWSKTFSGASRDTDEGRGVAVAADGSVYVTGSTWVEGQEYDLLLLKYSPAGALRWTRTFNGASDGNDVGAGVAVAADGSVYVTGSTSVAGQEYDLLLQRYSPAGTLRWTKTFNGASHGWDEGHGVAVAADGSVYVTGSTCVTGQQYNLLLQRYSPTGALRWTKTFNGASNGWDEGRGIVVDSCGAIYVTGVTWVEGQSDDLLLRKYSPTGASLWTKTHNGASDGSDAGWGVDVAADGSVYVTGTTHIAGARNNLLLQKYK